MHQRNEIVKLCRHYVELACPESMLAGTGWPHPTNGSFLYLFPDAESVIQGKYYLVSMCTYEQCVLCDRLIASCVCVYTDKLKEAQDALKEAIASLESSVSKDEGMVKV